jgi:SAM-dependent methyltransferase
VSSTAEGHPLPLVSCIMPTRDRRGFVPRAIACFLAQQYPHRELVIVDDGRDGVADLVPEDSRIKYVRLDGPPLTIGAKRNLAVEQASGPVIAHWDDDDWSAPRRLDCQVRTLLDNGADVCGLRRMLFADELSGTVWLYEYPHSERPWLIGGSLLYTRAFWAQAPFAEVQVGEDTRFLLGRSALRLAEVSDLNLYVATIRRGNTSAKNTTGAYWSRWNSDLRHLVGYDVARAAPIVLAEDPGVQRMKLNLGCCDTPLNGFVNVDMVPGPGIDGVDLARTWPWANDSVEHVRAWDIIEHLPDKIFTMNELWRVLAPGGTAEIVVPTTDGPGAFQDPTHVSFWNRRSFLYYEAGNPYRERFATHYGISARFRTLRERTDPSIDGPRLTILLQAIKA